MKLATTLLSGMLVAAPAAALAQNQPCPDSQAIKPIAEPGKETKAESQNKPGLVESVVETVTGRSASPKESETGAQQAPADETRPVGGDTNYPGFDAVKKTAPEAKAEQPRQDVVPQTAENGRESQEGKAQPEKKGLLESVVETLTGRPSVATQDAPSAKQPEKDAAAATPGGSAGQKDKAAPEPTTTGRSASPQGAAQTSQQPQEQEQRAGGDTNYPDLYAIKKTAAPASQRQ